MTNFMTNFLLAFLVLGLWLLILIFGIMPFVTAIVAEFRSRRPAPICGNCRYFARHFDGTFCDRRAIWRMANDPKCNIGEVRE